MTSKAKKFNVPCTLSTGQNVSIPVYIGEPNKDAENPIHFQASVLGEKGVSISPDILTSLSQLYKISVDNGVPFVDLCDYAFKTMTLSGGVKEGVGGNNMDTVKPIAK